MESYSEAGSQHCAGPITRLGESVSQSLLRKLTKQQQLCENSKGIQEKLNHGEDELYAAGAAKDKRRADESDAGDADEYAGYEG